jgi:superfamily II DNA or RNA helicase
VEHLVEAKTKADGMLFELPAATLPEQREERKRTIAERAAMAADIVDHNRPAVVWCHMNEEGDQLQKLISNAVQVSGRDDDDAKEEKFAAFSRGDIRVLITKPKIGAWGLNWQHAADIVYFPSHSYEQYYQSVRRCWRFGQKNDVTVNLVITEGERRVIENMKAKARKAEAMFANLVAEMGNAAAIVQKNEYTNQGAMPKWL